MSITAPLEETLLVWHAQLIEGRLVAGGVFCELAYSELHNRVCARNSKIARDQPHMVDEAVDQTLLDHIRTPTRYDPARSPIVAYLVMCAEGDLKNLLAREKRHSRAIPFSMLSRDDGENGVLDYDVAGNSNVEDTVITAMEVRARLEQLHTFFPKPLDRALLRLMHTGEKRTEVYAEVLEIGHLPRATQQYIVNKTKNRINMRKRRLALGDVAPEL